MSEPIRIVFSPRAVAIDVEPGTTLLAAARLAGVVIEAPCDGSGLCGKCRVLLSTDSLGAIDEGGRGEKVDGGLVSVLACMAQVRSSLEVLVSAVQTEGTLIVSHGASTVRSLEPHIRTERTSEATVVWAGEEVLALDSPSVANLGLAVDVGTTTLVATLVDLSSGAELSLASALNPQTEYGDDVLSRIRYAREPRGLATLQRVLVGNLNQLVAVACERAGRNPQHIHEAVLAGNPCMLHIAVGQDPAPLGRTPYVSSLTGDRYFPATVLGLAIAPHGIVYLPRWISGFVGADITAGMLATDLHRHPETTLFIDIGTNGEMVLCHRGQLWATSTAAGPAFEGVNIACGMRAAPGAIDAVQAMDGQRFQLHTIAAAPPVGICGSGLIDLIGTLVRSGAIAKNGRFDVSLAPPFGSWGERVGGRVLDLSEGVFVTQKDVRQVQLAKAAIRAGIDVLLARAGAQTAEVSRVLVAGSFGYHVSAESLGASGLVPESLARRVSAVGNTSKSGAVLLLTNRGARREVAEIAARTRAIDLAEDVAFERRFVRQMAFGEASP